jgi:hypothetical protein
MDLVQTYYIGELVAAVAVVASLLFVGLQVRQNTAATFSQTHQWVLQDETKAQELLIIHPEVASMIVKGEANPDQLSEMEWTRFSHYAFRRFGIWEATHLNHDGGLMTKDMLDVWNIYFSARLNKPGYQAYWRENRTIFFPTFRAYADAEVFPE